MVNTIEVAESEDFYQQVYDWVIKSMLPSIQVFIGCTITRDSSGRTSSVTLSFSKRDSTIEHRIIEREDYGETSGVKDKEKSQAMKDAQLDALAQYLSSSERPIKLPSRREKSYLIVEPYKNLETIFSQIR
ncbi:hypothetical protein J4455_03710 [Candidatus Woesearchaeota archaeon]|nr:hypothetical protein [Candidatus Woesearchaeota archaeon]